MPRFLTSLKCLWVPFLVLGALLSAAGVHAQSGAACTHYVNGTSGNDAATGTTTGTAWKTIGRANNTASTSVPSGSVVCIAPGTYYENVQPRRAGVTYRGLTTGGRYDVVVSGLDPTWIGGPSRPAGEPTWVAQGDGLYKWTWTPRTQASANWELSNDAGTFWFASYRIGDSGPEHAQRREMLVASTGQPGVGTSRDGRLEGHVMLPVGTLAGLNSPTFRNYASPEYGVYGAFWVETTTPSGPDGIMARPVAIYARFYGPNGNVTPDVAQPRIAARTATFIPRNADGNPGNVEDCGRDTNIGGLTVENIAFRHSNALIQRGSVCPGRSGSTFRNVAVEFANGAGINTGRHSESTDQNNTALVDQTGRAHRFVGIRSNYNGQLGMGGECDDCQVIDSELSYNNWKDHDYGWEAGGSKFSFTSRTLLRRVRAFRNNGPGIWFDIANQDNVIEGSWVDGNALAGIFLELYTVRTLVQHNVVSGTRRTRANTYTDFVNNYGGTGFGIQDAPETYLFHNTSVNNQGAGYYFNTTSRIDGANPGGRFGYPETTWAGSRGRMVNNVAAGNALISARPPGETANTFTTEAREIQIEDPTLGGARSTSFLGNLYLGHGTPGEAALGHHGFGLFPRTGGGGTGNTNPEWKALLGVPLSMPGSDERVLTYSSSAYANLAAPRAWPDWPTTLDMQTAPRQSTFPQIPAGSVPNRRQGYCYGWNGANPEAVLGSFYLDRPAPADCPRPNSQNIAYITTNTTLTAANSADYAGRETYVSDNVTLTISGTFTLQSSGGIPARLHLNGRLAGSGTIAVTGGSELVIRPLASTSGFTGSVPLTGAGSCLMVREGARFDLAPGQSIDASDGALVAVLTGGTLALGDGARMTFTVTAAAAQIRPGARVEMGPNARVEFFNAVQLVGTAAEPIVFERRDGSSRWGTVFIKGDGSTLRDVVFDGGTTNVQVEAQNVTLDRVTSRNAGAGGLRVYGGTRSATVTVTHSTLSNNVYYGLAAVGASDVVSVSGTTLSDNGYYGVSLAGAQALAFSGNVVERNGTHGLLVNSGALLEATQYTVRGNNRIAENGGHEIQVGTNSQVRLGSTLLSHGGTDWTAEPYYDACNAVVSSGDPSSEKLIYNQSAWTVGAEWDYFGGFADASRFYGPVANGYSLSGDPTQGAPCNSEPYIGLEYATVGADRTSDEVQGASQTNSYVSSSAARGAGPSSVATARRVDRLRMLRSRLAASPSAAGADQIVAELALFARADPGDRAGERQATLGVLRTLAMRLAAPAVQGRPAVEAAALFLVQNALASSDASGARALLDAYGERMTVPHHVRAVLGQRVSLLALEGRPQEALAALDVLEAAEQAAAATDPSVAAEDHSALRDALGSGLTHGRGAAAASGSSGAARFSQAPAAFETALLMPYPNPALRSATLPFTLAASAQVRIEVVDMLGRVVAVVVDGAAPAGRHEPAVDASRLASGSYLVRATVTADGETQAFARRLTVVR